MDESQEHTLFELPGPMGCFLVIFVAALGLSFTLTEIFVSGKTYDLMLKVNGFAAIAVAVAGILWALLKRGGSDEDFVLRPSSIQSRKELFLYLGAWISTCIIPITYILYRIGIPGQSLWVCSVLIFLFLILPPVIIMYLYLKKQEPE